MWHLKEFSKPRASYSPPTVHGKLWRLNFSNSFPLRGRNARCMVPTLDGRVTVGYGPSAPGLTNSGEKGVEIFTLSGSQADELLDVEVSGVSVFRNGRYVVRNAANALTMYYADWRRLDHAAFDVLEWEKGAGGVAVADNSRIYVVHQTIETVRVYTPKGGKPVTQILCRGIPISDLHVMSDGKLLVTSDDGGSAVRIIESVDGDGVERFAAFEEDAHASATVLHDGRVLIAWVKGQCLTIKLFTRQLTQIGVVLMDFEVDGTTPCRLRETSSGEIVFSTQEHLYFFTKGFPALRL